MPNANHTTAPEDEILEGIIIDDAEIPSAESSYESSFASEATRQDRLEESLHRNAAAVNATAVAASDLRHDSLEETTKNISNLKRMLGGLL
jgi:hypothetical protein